LISDGQRNIIVTDLLALCEFNEEAGDFLLAHNEDTISYLKIHRPYEEANGKAYLILGPFKLKDAILAAGIEVSKIPAFKRVDDGIQDITAAVTRLVATTGTDAEQRNRSAAFKGYRIPLRDGHLFRVRLHAEYNPAVMRLWRDIKAGTKDAAPTYFVWTSDGDCGGTSRESKIERKIHATFTEVRAAFDFARAVYLETRGRDAEVGLPIVDVANLRVAGNNIGVLKGWGMNSNGEAFPPGPDEIFVL